MKKISIFVLVALTFSGSPAFADVLPTSALQQPGSSGQNLDQVLLAIAEQGGKSDLPLSGVYSDSEGNTQILSYPVKENDLLGPVAAISKDSSVDLIWFDTPSPEMTMTFDQSPVNGISGTSHHITLALQNVSNTVDVQFFVDNSYSDSLDLGQPLTPTFAIGAVSTFALSGPLLLGDGSDYPNKSYFKYDAFIPGRFAPIPRGCDLLGKPGNLFNGNNRLFDAYAPQSKSKVWLEVIANWQLRSISYSRFVGQTEVLSYDPATNIVTGYATYQAPLTDIQVNPVWSVGADTATFSFKISSSNPACLGALPIYVEAAVQITRTGYATIIGQMRTVPSHEAYFKDDLNLNWKLLYAQPISSVSFDCFNPIVGLLTPECSAIIDASAHF